MNFQENSTLKLQKNLNEVPLINKIYVWSLIFEPMTYFSFAGSGGAIGIPFSLSRFLQIFIIIYFVLKFLSIDRERVVNYINSLKINKNFAFYVFIILSSTLFGLLFLYSYDLNKFGLNIETEQNQDGILKSYYFRPFFDLFILVYYYFYFIILPLFFLRTSNHFFT